MHRVRVFRAIDDLGSCQKFAEGHLNVLLDYGITKVTTTKSDWFFNPDVYVVLIESEDGSKTYGGERIHICNDSAKLPAEDAVSIVDTGIYDLVGRYRANGLTGELCGLWNSKEIAGKGYSVLLTKIGVALAKMLGIDSLFVLCAPYTVSMCQNVGFEIEESIGNQGTFYYPKLDLIATLLIVKDIVNLPGADETFRQRILDLTGEPVQVASETGPQGDFQIQYDLRVKKHMSTNEL